MERKVRAEKMFVLGIDGLDPRLTKKYVEMGLMPNTKKFIEVGAQREDLVMLGGHPTVTPPMWTTLSTGCYANVHGITGFYRRVEDLEVMGYNLDSRLCKAEQMWNVFAEAGKKTLVWHWPGCAWPPTSDSENLYVVDGTAPGSVHYSVALVDDAFFVEASEDFAGITLNEKNDEMNAACVIDDLDLDNDETTPTGNKAVLWKEIQSTFYTSELDFDIVQSAIKAPEGWVMTPDGAKEFTMLLSGGLIRRPALVLKNNEGIYDRVAIYKNKKNTEPMVICPLGEMVLDVVDEAVKNNKKYEKVNRSYRLLSVAEDGSSLRMYISAGLDMTNDSVWHPKRLFKEVTENVGYPMAQAYIGNQDNQIVTECLFPCWDACLTWQADALNHLIESEDLDIIFSHFHSVDAQEHQTIKYMADRPFNKNSVEVAYEWNKYIYKQADEYIGKFLHLLDKGWTIFIVSDHGQVAPKHDVPMLFDMCGLTTPLMEELGYTVLKTDNQGNKIGSIDWTKTRAVMQREGHVYINLKGRESHGIVDPEDKYELEEQIMTDLYSLKSKETGKRIVAVALRNKDAVLLGQGGPEAGDICVWMAEGYNQDHADSLSTTYGEADTSVSPIFIAAGKGLKKGYKTDRMIREVDLVPTMAALGGVRYPAQCEGAPVYQIFEEEL